MSEHKDDPPPPNPPDEPSADSPFPESGLAPPPDPPEAAAPPTEDEQPPPPPSWLQPSAPQAPPPGEPFAPASAPPGGGLVSGDPLGGGSGFPSGYSSPPPPGAGGGFAAPPAQAPLPAAAAGGTYVLAGWWRRVGAALIDGFIIIMVAFVVMAPLGIGLFATDSSNEGGFVALVLGLLAAGLVIAVVALAYAPVMMGKTNGRTLGRMATGIRVVRADGQPITIGFAALREVAVKTLLIGTVGGSLTFGLASLLDVLWPLWDDENRALHDFVVNTRTVMAQ